MRNKACDPFASSHPAERRNRVTWRGLAQVGFAATAVFVATGGAAYAARKIQTIYSFRNLKGTIPQAGVIADSAGNLYGTAGQGGLHDHGVVFELSPPAPGKKMWTERVLHSFDGNDGDGAVSGLIEDGAGNLYGTTVGGGRHGNGLVFELSPPTLGKTAWTETVIARFANAKRDGAQLFQGLIADAAGNLYGTSVYGGAANKGLVFELSPPGPGQTKWTETVLHAFDGTDGKSPDGGVIADSAGNLYGATQSGGASGDGVVYELSPPAQGQTTWTETVLHAFDGTDGDEVNGQNVSLIKDGAGNLYGTTRGGGPHHTGCIFELSPPKQGQAAWTETVIYAFPDHPAKLKPRSPNSTLVADRAGNLYGTTGGYGYNGGNNYGDVYELSPPAQGQTTWTRTALHAFNETDGNSPEGGLLLDGEGNLYGTTNVGGKFGDGVAFKITP